MAAQERDAGRLGPGRRRVIARFVGMLLSGVGLFATSLRAEELPTVTEIRERVAQALRDYDSVACEFTLVETIPADSPIKPLIFEGPGHWKWAKAGKVELIEMAARKMPDGKHWHRVRIALDRDRVARADFSSDDPDKILGVNKSALYEEFDRQFSPAHFLGLRLFELNESLPSYLEKPNLEVLGWEKIAGDECLHLRVKQIVERTGGMADCEVWLSRQVGWIPRRIRSTIAFDPTLPKVVDLYEVEEFQEVEVGSEGRKAYFPKRAKNTGRGVDRAFTVDRVTLAGVRP